jgi:hypothetical protein
MYQLKAQSRLGIVASAVNMTAVYNLPSLYVFLILGLSSDTVLYLPQLCTLFVVLETESSYCYWIQRSRFHLRTETELRLRKIVF